MSRILVTFLLVLGLFPSLEGNAQQKRAVVIGINDYTPAETSSSFALRKWKNLDGAVNDADAFSTLLETHYGFDSVTKLLNKDATRQAILDGITDLVNASKPGDVAVFYYAGHGSQMKNTASNEQDGLDETIVPYDVISGAQDIRDKELRDAFNTLIDKGVLLTLIFDSCHSGSITRGVPGGQTRYLAPSPIVVSDDSNPPRPVDRGALVISAAQDDELASELVDADGSPRGAFSWALNQAILSSDKDASSNALFLRLRALMKSKGMKQEPVISGLKDRLERPLFGGKAETVSATEVIVSKIEGKDVYLQGGLATGLRTGSELLASDGNRYLVEQSLGMSQSIAVNVSGSTLPKPGDVLSIDKWISSASAPLRIFVPPSSIGFDVLVKLAKEWEPLKPISDPTIQPANTILSFDGAWRLLSANGNETEFASAPSRSDLEKAIEKPADGSAVALFISYPPFDSFGNALGKDMQTMGRAQSLEMEAEKAEYLLAGIWNGEDFQYAWILRESTGTTSVSPAPPRSDWQTVTKDRLIASSILATDLGKLDVIWGWINLESPPDDASFPYHMSGFENIRTGEIKLAGDTLAVGEQYRLVLKTTNKQIQDAQMNAVINNVGKRFLYIFALDQFGNGSLLYPSTADGNVENDINYFTNLPLELTIPSENALFTVSQPVGVDSFFLMSTAEPIPQPDILNFSGIRTRSEPEGPQTDLSKLLFDLGGGKRSTRKPVPLNWSIEKLVVKSVEAR